MRRVVTTCLAITLLLGNVSLYAQADEPIAEGVVAKKLPTGEDAKLRETSLTDSDRDHWAYQPLERPEPPKVKGDTWVQNPIDRFILARLEEKQIEPLPMADWATLVRRVTFDLTGLPPDPEESRRLEAAAKRDEAYAEYVDKLLASRAYGERWGQHWLDVARFAETDGFEHDKVRPEAWRYRDWVIDSLNRDLPYDEFVRQQLAGDELHPDDAQAAIATGFLIAGPDMPDINLKEERRHMVLNELTSTVGSVFLGLQLGCAQCHDHKYDPLSQADFYRLRAVFESAELFKPNQYGRVVYEPGGKIEPSRLMVRGDFRRPGPLVEPAFPRIANPWNDRPADAPKDAKTLGRRSELARWITRPDHPLATRVIANWLWQHHFGEGLSRSPGDFGVMGDEPTHPELLDWLATELVREGWSMKRIHKLIVTSATYRTASRPTRETMNQWTQLKSADPQNYLLGRMPRRRLEGEAIRDAMLASADRLSENRGGPGVMPPLPRELLGTLLKDQWKTSPNEEDHRRRSVYLFVRRNLRYPLFESFDKPDTNASCPRRNRSTTAPQALVLLNSEFSLSAARDLAKYLAAQSPADDGALIAVLYHRTLGREPTEDEITAAEKFLQSQTALSNNSFDAAVVDLCLAMFNLNEFIYVD